MRALLLLVLVSACSPAPPPVETPSGVPVAGVGGDDLDAARARWAAADLDGYTMTVTRSCFCPPEWRGPYTVEVEGGTVASVIYEGRPAEQGDPPSVEDLFELLATSYAEGAARVEVTYHAELGYPISLYIDRDERMADEEVGYEVSELVPR